MSTIEPSIMINYS